MFKLHQATFSVLTSIAVAAVFSCSAWGQSQAQQADSLLNESNAMRELLITHYSNSSLFGDLLAKNSKIRGAARRLKMQIVAGADLEKQTSALDQLLLDLETNIEQANFQDSRTESAEVSKQLGVMVSSIASLQGRSPQSADRTQQQVTTSRDPRGLTSVVESEFAPLETGDRPSDLNSPLLIGSTDLRDAPDLEFATQETDGNFSIDLPPPPIDLDSNQTLQLPDLTVPSPEVVEQNSNQTVLKPRSPQADPPFIDRNRAPQLQAPRPLNFSNNVLPPQPRLSAPIRVELHTFGPIGFGYRGYQPYGGYWSNRSYGGYGYGGGYCPRRW